MTADAGDDRLTRGVTPESRSYWEETALLYGDVVRRADPRTEARRVLNERLATAHWRLTRIDVREGRRRVALASLVETIRIQPSFVPRRITQGVADRFMVRSKAFVPRA